MKLISVLICDDKDQWEFYLNLFKIHFPKLQLICKLSVDDAFAFFKEEGMPLFTIVDSQLKVESLEKTFHELCVATDKKPVIFIEPANKNNLHQMPVDFYDVNPANGVIQQPFELEQFLSTIRKVLKLLHSEMLQLSSVILDLDSCIPIKVRNFYRFRKVPYDVYAEISTDKYIKIIAKNEPYTEGLIQRQIMKKVKYFYLEKKDHLQFLDRSAQSLLKILQTPHVAKRSIIATQVSAVAVIHEYVRTIGVCDNVIALTKKIIDKTEFVYRSLNSFVEVIRYFQFKTNDISEQAVLTMYLCEAILQEMGWNNDIMRQKLGLASIIHDSLLPNEEMASITSANDPRFFEYSPEEQEEYLNHPKRTALVALEFAGFHEPDFVILQHHELPNGHGFPQGINAHQITELSCIFILANNFVCELSNKKLSLDLIRSILNAFSRTYNTGNFKKPLQILRAFFNC